MVTQKQTNTLPKHVAVVMDGNGRWAKQRRLPRLEGHRRGAGIAHDIVEWASDAGVRQITLFAFSAENWSRPKLEVQGLMALLATVINKQLPDMIKKGVRFQTLGDISGLPNKVKDSIATAKIRTKDNSKIELILCLNYGGQQEIVAGVRQLLQKASCMPDPRSWIDSISVADFREHLWSAPLNTVDLIIRTGGEKRISNFILWDAAYAELYFSDKLWPDFNQTDFMAALEDYANRERRFGLTGAQVTHDES
ncbi:MAG: polyprenyl diphosphate synthase [Mariprofundaceae bacterium]